MNDSFLDKIRVAGKEDERWQARGRELVWLREVGKKMPDEWIEKDGSLNLQKSLVHPRGRIPAGRHSPRLSPLVGSGVLWTGKHD